MLKIVSGDIIEVAKEYNAEAVVNPNNKYMDYGCGVCGAIYDAAGVEQMETYCHNKWIKDMEVNEVRITPRFFFAKRSYTYICTNIHTRRTPIRKIERVLFKPV